MASDKPEKDISTKAYKNNKAEEKVGIQSDPLPDSFYKRLEGLKSYLDAERYLMNKYSKGNNKYGNEFDFNTEQPYY